MKIALCISGHLRCYKQILYLYEKRILDPLRKMGDVDIFMHVWEKIDTKESWAFKSEGYQLPEENADVTFLKENFDVKYGVIEKEETRYDFLNIANLFGTNIEEFNNANRKTKNYNKITDGKGLFYQIPMTYKWHVCNNLKKKYEEAFDFKYDFVVRHRMDAMPIRPLNENFFVEKTLILNYAEKNGIGDLIWIADNDTMDIMCDYFLNLGKYFQPRATEFNLFEYARDKKIKTYYNRDFKVILVRPTQDFIRRIESKEDL